MKKFYFTVLFLSCFATGFSQPVFTYGGTPVSKEEFLKAYNKNKTPVADKEKALREYLELYTRFKLKVKAAQALRFDTLPQLKNDLENFRTQVEDSYMNDEKGLNSLVDEAFERSQKDLHVLHFYVGIDSKMKPEDTLKAWRAMREVKTKIDNGKMDYDQLVSEISFEIIPIKGTDLGFITAFSIPYQYENIVYNLKLGETSKPYRSKNGIHVFRLIEERKSMGKWKVAQILVAFPPGSSLDPKKYELKADSLYKLLQAGADFAELAKNNSDDKLTYLTGGEMPEFGTGKFELPYEKKVLSLTKDGDYTKPFMTQYGYHIVKRLSQTATPADKNDAAYMFDIKQKTEQSDRITASKEKFTKEVVKMIGFKRNIAVRDADIFKAADSVSANPTAEEIKKSPVANKVLFSFAKANIKGSDWLNFIKDYKSSPELYKGEPNAELFEKYIDITALEYYKKHLEEYNADFRYQMQEFKEGNMLFEIMERNVWGAAANDDAGLRKTYEQNKSKYLWAPSGDILLFNCKDEKTAKAAMQSLANGKNWQAIVEESGTTIQADSGRYELSQVALPDGASAVAGYVSSVVINNTDGSASFYKILNLYPGNQQRSFEEAKGLVINDYQTVVEEKWVAELKKKYPVKNNEVVFKTLLKD